jgi:hypothetical protein
MSVSFSPWNLGMTSYGFWHGQTRVNSGWTNDSYSVATAKGVDVEEGEGLVTFKELEAGDVS